MNINISKRLAKALNGEIEVTSQLGRGSTFTLSVDAGSLKNVKMINAIHTAPSKAQDLLPKKQPTLSGYVLFAEDVPDVQLVIGEILRTMNLEVDMADNGRMACDMAQKSKDEGKPYDLIFMDIQMPKMNGYEAAKWLRKHDWKSPIVAVTAHAMIGDREKCLEAGCDDYIAKPLTATSLQDILTRYLGGKGDRSNLCEAPSGPFRQIGPVPFSKPFSQPGGILNSGILDPDKVAALIDAFLGELPARAELIDKAFQQRNRDELFQLTHQLKGSAGIHGFENISESARTICDRMRAGDDLEEFQAAVSELLELCKQAAAHY